MKDARNLFDLLARRGAGVPPDEGEYQFAEDPTISHNQRQLLIRQIEDLNITNEEFELRREWENSTGGLDWARGRIRQLKDIPNPTEEQTQQLAQARLDLQKEKDKRQAMADKVAEMKASRLSAITQEVDELKRLDDLIYKAIKATDIKTRSQHEQSFIKLHKKLLARR